MSVLLPLKITTATTTSNLFQDTVKPIAVAKTEVPASLQSTLPAKKFILKVDITASQQVNVNLALMINVAMESTISAWMPALVTQLMTGFAATQKMDVFLIHPALIPTQVATIPQSPANPQTVQSIQAI